MKSLEGADVSIMSLVWDPRGDALVSVGADGIMRIWDCQRAEITEAIEAHDDRCWSINAILSGGQSACDALLTCAADGVVILWENISEQVYEEGELNLMK